MYLCHYFAWYYLNFGFFFGIDMCYGMYVLCVCVYVCVCVSVTAMIVLVVLYVQLIGNKAAEQDALIIRYVCVCMYNTLTHIHVYIHAHII